MNIHGLKPSVVAALPSIFAKWEGNALPYMYTDSKGYVTTGTGNEIDPVGAALTLPWRHGASGPLASQDEIAAAWQTVKDAWPDVQSTASQSLTDLRLDSSAINALIDRTIAANWAILRTEFANADSLPADAQLVLLSIAWAWGAGFPRVWGANGAAFVSAMNKRDYAKASKIMQQANAHEETINPGIVPRVQGQVVMLKNAANNRLRPGTLFYPGTATGLPWKSPLALGAVGALAGGPVGLAVGLGAGLVASYAAPYASGMLSRVRARL